MEAFYDKNSIPKTLVVHFLVAKMGKSYMKIIVAMPIKKRGFN